MQLKGVTVYDLYVASGFKRTIYDAFEKNMFTKATIEFIGEKIGEDLSMYINAKVGR
jgi:hypothetical protein